MLQNRRDFYFQPFPLPWLCRLCRRYLLWTGCDHLARPTGSISRLRLFQQYRSRSSWCGPDCSDSKCGMPLAFYGQVLEHYNVCGVAVPSWGMKSNGSKKEKKKERYPPYSTINKPAKIFLQPTVKTSLTTTSNQKEIMILHILSVSIVANAGFFHPMREAFLISPIKPVISNLFLII